MPKKKQNVAVKVAVITAIGAIIAEDQPEKHQFQKINLINPIKLTYEKTEEGYKRVN